MFLLLFWTSKCYLQSVCIFYIIYKITINEFLAMDSFNVISNPWIWGATYPVNIYLFKVSNENTKISQFSQTVNFEDVIAGWNAKEGLYFCDEMYFWRWGMVLKWVGNALRYQKICVVGVRKRQCERSAYL